MMTMSFDEERREYCGRSTDFGDGLVLVRAATSAGASRRPTAI